MIAGSRNLANGGNIYVTDWLISLVIEQTQQVYTNPHRMIFNICENYLCLLLMCTVENICQRHETKLTARKTLAIIIIKLDILEGARTSV